jgi:hypothetical protein
LQTFLDPLFGRGATVGTISSQAFCGGFMDNEIMVLGETFPEIFAEKQRLLSRVAEGLGEFQRQYQELDKLIAECEAEIR